MGKIFITNQDDQGLWEKISSDIKTITKDNEQLVIKKSPAPSSIYDGQSEIPFNPDEKINKPSPSIKPSIKTLAKIQNIESKYPPLELSNPQGLNKATGRRFIRGQLSIQSRLDLHGCTRKEAYARVSEFIMTSHQQNLRTIQIITGKGKGILRDEVPKWLNTAILRPMILAITYPKQNEGGTGAINLLLRRAINKNPVRWNSL